MAARGEVIYRVSSPAGATPDLFDLASRVREALEPVYRDGYVEALVRCATRLLDDRVTAPVLVPAVPAGRHLPTPSGTGPFTPAFAAASRIDAGLTGPDLACALDVFTDPSDPARPVLAVLWERYAPYRQVWEALPGIQLTTGEASDDELTRDGELASVEPGRVAPEWTWQLFTEESALTPFAVYEHVEDAIPSRAWRAQRLAEARVDPFEPGHAQVRPTGEVQAEIAALAAQLEQTLPRVTVKDLYRTY